MNMLSRSQSLSFFIKELRFKRISLNFRSSKCGYLNQKLLPYTLQSHHSYITSSPVQNLHTVKGWKTVARDGHKEDNNVKKEFLSCEEGTDAVPHHMLMSQLQMCDTVPDQIKSFCSLISITSKDVENRKDFCKSLTEVFKPYFPEFKVNLFGSSINGLGFKGSDVDISIQTMFTDKEYVKGLKQVPTLDSVSKGEVSLDTVARLPPPYLLRFVRRILRAHCPDIHEPIFFIKARCPLLRFYNAKYNVFCDFTSENINSLCNTKLIRFICQLDERFSTLTKIIRYWGKYGAFVGDIDLFNSYGFSLLVVHFLQQRNPPVLPPIKDLIEKSEYLRNGDINDDDLLFNDLKKFEPSENTQTVEELLREFFFYYLTFDFSRIMLPLRGSNMPKMDYIPETITVEGGPDSFEFSTVTIEDPFRLNNAAAAAKYKACRRFFSGLIEACKTYQDENLWHPGTDKWGICSLFQRTISEQEMVEKWHKSNTYTLKLPLETDVYLLTQILHEGLLFRCAEGITDDLVPQPCFKLNCTVHHNTWVGRDWIYQNHPSSLTNKLEIEKYVSNQLLKNRESIKPPFTFSCECFENKHDNDLDVVLTFPKSKYPPVAAIFLKEYIPSMYKKLTM